MRAEIPPAVAAVAAVRPIRAVWQNRLGGLTCEAGTGPDRRAELRRGMENGRLDPVRWPSPGPPLHARRALDLLAVPPPIDRLVVCHGDSCAPNALLTEDGRWSAHVDLGDLGLADRWADLAIATWNVTLNYGPGWEDLLLDASGVAPDAVRTGYYRLLGRCY